jgi:hypothetical protein
MKLGLGALAQDPSEHLTMQVFSPLSCPHVCCHVYGVGATNPGHNLWSWVAFLSSSPSDMSLNLLCPTPLQHNCSILALALIILVPLDSVLVQNGCSKSNEEGLMLPSPTTIAGCYVLLADSASCGINIRCHVGC